MVSSATRSAMTSACAAHSAADFALALATALVLDLPLGLVERKEPEPLRSSQLLFTIAASSNRARCLRTSLKDVHCFLKLVEMSHTAASSFSQGLE